MTPTTHLALINVSSATSRVGSAPSSVLAGAGGAVGAEPGRPRHHPRRLRDAGPERPDGRPRRPAGAARVLLLATRPAGRSSPARWRCCRRAPFPPCWRRSSSRRSAARWVCRRWPSSPSHGRQAGVPAPQGRNQAYNHVGSSAPPSSSASARRMSPEHRVLGLGCSPPAAIVAAVTTPAGAFNRRRAAGWKEDDADDAPQRSAILAVLSDRRLLILSSALALFSLSNGSMLSLIGQKLVASGQDGTGWTARYVMVAQLVMIPVRCSPAPRRPARPAPAPRRRPARCCRCAPCSRPWSPTRSG